MFFVILSFSARNISFSIRNILFSTLNVRFYKVYDTYTKDLFYIIMYLCIGI